MATVLTKQLRTSAISKLQINWWNLNRQYFGKRHLASYCTCNRGQPVYDNKIRGTSPQILCDVNNNIRPNVRPNDRPNFLPYVRHRSNDAFDRDNEEPNKKKVKPVFIAVPNPFKVIRNWMFGFIIRAYFDPEFNFRDFTEGAKQGFSIISKEMSTGKLENIERLISRKLIPELTEVIGNMNMKERSSLATSVDDILYSFPQNITVHYDDNGGKFLYILMRFWSISSLVPQEESEGYGMKIGKPPPGVSQEDFDNMGSLISCTYEFLREVTPGVEPEWTVTHIQHGKLIDTEARGYPP